MNITPDTIIYFQAGFVKINATLVFTWLVMFLLAAGSWLITRNLSSGTNLSRGQNLLEIIVNMIQSQLREVTEQDPGRFLPFIGTLFLFILTCNTLSIVPGFHPPTGSLSTTGALALCVFVAVPYFGITSRGWKAYLGDYLKPTPMMLPFNIMGELTRTLSLAIRLFGNMMSGSMIAATVLAIAPLLFPIVMNALGLLLGVIQAYIFSILALVFIASASRSHDQLHATQDLTSENGDLS
ncbi:F0F1 ATP synthase subunit A [Schlesneria sp. DSM 10557]|uniref:F0F1 ATP synthase subunit A n=1 Tax=Schlesneria sp. DSM 10557 TaxID=3044399 RepID=UPI0035A0D725